MKKHRLKAHFPPGAMAGVGYGGKNGDSRARDKPERSLGEIYGNNVSQSHAKSSRDLTADLEEKYRNYDRRSREEVVRGQILRDHHNKSSTYLSSYNKASEVQHDSGSEGVER